MFKCIKVSKGAKIRNRYNRVPHLTQDTNGNVTKSQLDTTNESQEVRPFPAGEKASLIFVLQSNTLSINRVNNVCQGTRFYDHTWANTDS